MLIEVFYCTPSGFSPKSYVAGMRKFDSADEFVRWLATEQEEGPILITHFQHIKAGRGE